MAENSLFAILLRSSWWMSFLVACRRWKAGRTGVEPLRELQAAREASDAQGATYVALGEVTDTARAYAAKHGLALMQGPELAVLLRRSPLSRRA
jgi:restriction system protein